MNDFPDNNFVGRNIRKLRKENRITQQTLAQRIGITKATVSAYENCTRLPSYEVLIKLAQYFHVSTDYLLGLSEGYLIDVTCLNEKQRSVVQQLINLLKEQNEGWV